MIMFILKWRDFYGRGFPVSFINGWRCCLEWQGDMPLHVDNFWTMGAAECARFLND